MQHVQHRLHIASKAHPTMSALCTQCMRIAQHIHTADAVPARLQYQHLLVNVCC